MGVCSLKRGAPASPGAGRPPLSCRAPGTVSSQPGAAARGLGPRLAHAARPVLPRRRPSSGGRGAWGVDLKRHRRTARQGGWAGEPRNQAGRVSAAPPGPGADADRQTQALTATRHDVQRLVIAICKYADKLGHTPRAPEGGRPRSLPSRRGRGLKPHGLVRGLVQGQAIGRQTATERKATGSRS